MLKSVYEVADACLQTIAAAADAEAARDQVHRGAIEADLVSGNLTEGFLAAFDCLNRASLQCRKNEV